MNTYLAKLQKDYAALQASARAITDKAATENRQLTEQERELVSKMTEQMAGQARDIEMLQAQETESARIAATEREIASLTRGQVQGPTGQFGSQTLADVAGPNAGGERLAGGAQTTMRDPGHYRRTGNGSFFRDGADAMLRKDQNAARRLVESAQFQLAERGMTEAEVRAITTSSGGAGLIAPKWMTELFAAYEYFGRPLTRAIRNISLGNDPRPMTLPKQTQRTGVGVQAAENDHPVTTPEYNSSTDTVTPITITGAQIFSRQLLDSATPAVDQLIMDDLREQYDEIVERRTVLMIEQANTSLLTASGSVAITDATHYHRRIIQAMVTVFKNRKRVPDLIFGSVARYGKVLELQDTTGRMVVLPGLNMGPSNAAGLANLRQAFGGAIWHGTEFLATPGEYDDGRLYTLGRQDAIHFESDLLQFRYEEKHGPESIEIGIWGYNAWWMMRKPDSVKGLSITGDGESA